MPEHSADTDAKLPALPQLEVEPAPPRTPLVPERSDFLEGDTPAADKVEAFLAQALAATGTGRDAPVIPKAVDPARKLHNSTSDDKA